MDAAAHHARRAVVCFSISSLSATNSLSLTSETASNGGRVHPMKKLIALARDRLVTSVTWSRPAK